MITSQYLEIEFPLSDGKALVVSLSNEGRLGVTRVQRCLSDGMIGEEEMFRVDDASPGKVADLLVYYLRRG